jgi:hypothetical protein
MDVAHHEIEQECTFAAAGFPDDVDMALAFLARKNDVCAVRRCCNRKRLELHNVAPAPGENPCCLRSPRLPSC